jgi:hypothetical protein
VDFIRRPASESPILQRMLDDATTDEDVAKAMAYGAKVDAFNRTGEVTVTVLEYEGPDLSPGAERENSMKLKGRSRPKPISPIAGSGGWKVVDLVRGDED